MRFCYFTLISVVFLTSTCFADGFYNIKDDIQCSFVQGEIHCTKNNEPITGKVIAFYSSETNEDNSWRITNQQNDDMIFKKIYMEFYVKNSKIDGTLTRYDINENVIHTDKYKDGKRLASNNQLINIYNIENLNYSSLKSEKKFIDETGNPANGIAVKLNKEGEKLLLFAAEYPLTQGKINGEAVFFGKLGEIKDRTVYINGIIEKNQIKHCVASEKDLLFLGAALADYFSVPTRENFNRLSSQSNKVTFTPSNTVQLSDDNEATITSENIGGAVYYGIKIYDTKGKCPQGYREDAPRWSKGPEPGIYSYTI